MPMVSSNKTTINLAKKYLIYSSLSLDVTKRLLISRATSHKKVIISIVDEPVMMHPTIKAVN